MLDIHTHILPAVDDGPSDIETSIKLLEIMAQQGITSVLATPHFIATEENLEEYLERVNNSLAALTEEANKRNLPSVHFGSEVFYFNGIGKSPSISELCLGKSNYLLLELPNCPFSERLFQNIIMLRENLNIIPIIAHIERYTHEYGFKKLLKLVANGTVLAQINASSVLDATYKKHIIKMIKKGYISFIATDTHSLNGRKPIMDAALCEIEKIFSTQEKEKFINNSLELYKEIIGENICEE